MKEKALPKYAMTTDNDETDSGQSRHAVGTTDEVKADSPLVADVEGTTVAVFYVDGEYHALDDTCPHQGGPLGDGKVEDGCVYCPWHGWEFDIQTGEHGQGSARATKYDVVAEDGQLYVAL